MDPESGLDAVRNVAIQNGRIVAVSVAHLEGRRVIDATGLVVAPGFIDLHQHSQTEEAYRAKVRDGVTTALEMEEGVADIDQFCSEREGKARINYGASIGHEHLRKALLLAAAKGAPENELTRVLTKQEIQALRQQIERGLSRGAAGVGILMLDTPAATPQEVLEMFRAAAKFHGATVYIHVRDLKQPQYWLGTDEALTDSLITGAPVHIVHANSSYQEDVEEFLGMVAAAPGPWRGCNDGGIPLHGLYELNRKPTGRLGTVAGQKIPGVRVAGYGRASHASHFREVSSAGWAGDSPQHNRGNSASSYRGSFDNDCQRRSS
jgi:cytosine/adenosine deaminase-related metal-dependent hydrolase